MPDHAPPRLTMVLRPSDRSWAGDAPYEDPGPCSRCGALLGEHEVPLLFWNASGRLWRYHVRCVGGDAEEEADHA